MIVSALCTLSFVAGLGVAHAYRDDEALSVFAEALCTIIRLPTAKLRAAFTPKAEETTKLATRKST